MHLNAWNSPGRYGPGLYEYIKDIEISEIQRGGNDMYKIMTAGPTQVRENVRMADVYKRQDGGYDPPRSSSSQRC